MAQLGFALLLLLGSSFEVVNLLVPSWLPAIQDDPMMELHHRNAVVYWWTLQSNVVSAIVALMLITGAVGVLRGRASGSRLSRQAIRVLFVILIGAAIISSIYTVPPLVEMLADPHSGPVPMIFLISIVGSLLGLAFAGTLFWLGHRRILRLHSLQ